MDPVLFVFCGNRLGCVKRKSSQGLSGLGSDIYSRKAFFKRLENNKLKLHKTDVTPKDVSMEPK